MLMVVVGELVQLVEIEELVVELVEDGQFQVGDQGQFKGVSLYWVKDENLARDIDAAE